MLSEVHSRQVDIDELRGGVDHGYQVVEELVKPLLVLWYWVLTEIEILDLLAVLADDFHQISELSTMNIDALKVQLLDLGDI